MIAENLNRLRKCRGYSKMKLARKSNVSVRTIEHIEYKKMINPKFQTLQKLAEGLEVSLEELLKA